MSQNRNKKHTRRQKQPTPWPMIALIVGGLLLILGAVLTYAQSIKPKAPIEVAGGPSLRVDKEQVNLGDVKLGQTVKVSFDLTNVGDQPLSFSEAPTVEVKEGC